MERRSLLRVVVCAAIVMCCANARVYAADSGMKPKVRTITAFVRMDPAQSQKAMDEALAFLRQAKGAFEQGGYEVQTIRMTLQPFVQYTEGKSIGDSLRFFKQLEEYGRKNGVLVNIGQVAADEIEPQYVEVLSQALATTRLQASMAVADESGVRWNAVAAAAKVIKYVEEHSPNGANNFNFTAVAIVQPYGPFFPASFHDGPGHKFAIGWEAGAFVSSVLGEAHGDIPTAKRMLSQRVNEHAPALDRIAMEVAKQSKWEYMGLDASPAPNTDSSIGAGIESLIGGKFGTGGTLAAAATITDSIRSVWVKRVGFSGLMLPVLEDPVIAQRWSEGTVTIDALLAYSSVCGTGLDTIPLPGDVTEQELVRMIGDMASLSVKWQKPLTARLIPAPGKKAGERTNFDFGVAQFPNTTLQPVR